MKYCGSLSAEALYDIQIDGLDYTEVKKIAVFNSQLFGQ